MCIRDRPIVLVSVDGPCPSILAAETVTLMSDNGGQREEGTLITYSQLSSIQETGTVLELKNVSLE